MMHLEKQPLSAKKHVKWLKISILECEDFIPLKYTWNNIYSIAYQQKHLQ